MSSLTKNPFSIAWLAVVLVALIGSTFAAQRWAGATGTLPLGVSDTVYAIAADTPEVLRIAPDGRIVASANIPEHPAKIWFVGGEKARDARVVVLGFQSTRLWSFNASDLSDMTETKLDIRPMLVAPSPDRRHIAIAETGPGTVILLDAATLEEVGRVDGLVGAHDLRFGPNGEFLFVSTLIEGSLAAVRVSDFTVTDTVEFADFEYGVDHMSRTPDGELGFVVSPVHPFIEPVSLGADLSTLPRVELPSRPFRALVGPRGENAWILSQEAPELYQLGLPSDVARETQLSSNTINLSGVPRTLAPEPFADTKLVATFSGIERVAAGRGALEHLPTDNPVRVILPMEGAALSLMLHEDGTLSRQHAHAALSPEPLDVPRLFAVTAANDLAFCHG